MQEKRPIVVQERICVLEENSISATFKTFDQKNRKNAEEAWRVTEMYLEFEFLLQYCKNLASLGSFATSTPCNNA